VLINKIYTGMKRPNFELFFSYFCADLNLHRCIFTILGGEERYGEYVSISWKSGTVHIKRNTETVSFPFYWINDIRSSDNDASLSCISIE
jgi:hypothetical protein